MKIPMKPQERVEMKFGSYQFSGAAMMASGALHILALIYSPGLFMLGVALLFGLMGYFLYRGKTWLGWFVFLFAAFGVAVAIFGIFGAGAWVYWLILIADLITAASTFWLIWKKP